MTAQDLGKGIHEQLNRQMPDMNDVLWLIRNGADLNVVGPGNQTPLGRAMGFGNEVLIKEMLAHRADVNARFGGRGCETILQVAVAAHPPSRVKLLLEARGDVFLRNAAGDDCLTIAKKRGDAEILELVEERAQAQRPDYETRKGFAAAVARGLPVQKPFSALKPLKIRPQR